MEPLIAPSQPTLSIRRLKDINPQYWLSLLIVVLVASFIGRVIFVDSMTLTAEAASADGIVLGAAGLTVSILGFALTIWQLDKTQGAADAALMAVDNLKERINIYDATIEANKAISLIQEAQRHLKIPAWDSFLASVNLLRLAFLKLEDFPSILGEGQRGDIRVALEEINGFSTRVEKGIMKNSVSIDRGRVLTAMKVHEQMLVKLSVGLQRKML